MTGDILDVLLRRRSSNIFLGMRLGVLCCEHPTDCWEPVPKAGEQYLASGARTGSVELLKCSRCNSSLGIVDLPTELKRGEIARPSKSQDK